jgi:CDP-4-dehydro-6-deoxyglucose reductase, E3
MFQVSLKNNKTFTCDSNTTIFEAAKTAGIFLEHSCLTARCRSCVVKITDGATSDKLDDLVLSDDEKHQNFALSCNAIPTTDLLLDVEDLGNVTLYDKKIVPAKIQSIQKLTHDVIKVSLRLPPNANFKYNSGQYVNLIKGNLKRSYSVANACKEKTSLEFFIKKYEKGLMSQYWFEEAKENDLLRMEGPLGSFFLRESTCKNIVFLATGTGIAPIKAILENIQASPLDFEDKKFFVFFGARYKEDVFWEPNLENKNIEVNYIPVLSRQNQDWTGERGYVQDAVLRSTINLEGTQVYACGSNEMIQAAKEVFIKNKLSESNFFSDAFVETN